MREETIEQPGHKWTYEQLAERADECRAILKRRGVLVHPASSLHAELNRPHELLKVWKDESLGMDAKVALLVRAGNANRIADAVINSQDDSGDDTMTCLDRMTRNALDLESRSPSQAKNAFWELELLTRLRRHGASTRLAEPDIVVDFGFGDYGIACKKCYSEKKVETQLRKGAHQVESVGLKGIVAINLDELVPAEAILRSSTARAASDRLARILLEFVERHRKDMTYFAKAGRIDGVLLSATAHVEAERASPPFTTYVEMAIWSLNWEQPTEASKLAAERLSQIKKAFPSART